MAVNYNMLHRVFDSPDLAKPQSTQAHWDSAVGDIKAIQQSGLTLGEVLVYYRLHKFQTDIVRRVKDMHKIVYPNKASINLEEAIYIMNKITAEEATLTEDIISVEQGMQNHTLTATPKVFQHTKSTPQNQSYSTPQTGSTCLPQGGAINKSGNRGGKGWSNNSGKSGQSSTQPYCHMCESNDHASFNCTTFTSPETKRQELVRLNKCPECARKPRFMNTHRCFQYISCSQCDGNHRRWLCTQKNNNTGPQNGSPPKK